MVARIQSIHPVRGLRGSMLGPALALWGVGLLAVVVLLWLTTDISGIFPNFFLLPWVVLAGAVILAPSAWLIYKGRFDFFHPLVFATWSYIFPAFVIGGLIVAFDLVEWYFLSFIEDPRYTLPLSLVYISIGFAGLTAGYFMPVGRWLSNIAEKRAPKWEWRPERFWIAGLVLLAIGSGVNILGFLQGILGFQRNIDIGSFDAALYFLLTLLTMGTVLLWLSVFSTKQRTGMFYIILMLLILFIPLRMAFMGSRGGLIVGLLPIVFAYYHSGRKIKLKSTLIFATLAMVALIVGSAYGTIFRNIKGTEASVAVESYSEMVLDTFDHMLAADPGVILTETSNALIARVENLTSVAVVVSNYEKLAPYEAAYGLENNIINDLFGALIPRFLWTNKPPTSDARSYSDLYFNFGDNSFAVTPFGDLLRNFGPIGIPFGMMLLGFYLRFIYSSLIETPLSSIWRKTCYYVLLTVVSYEAFYATLFPSIVRVIFVIVIGLCIIRFLLPKPQGPMVSTGGAA